MYMIEREARHVKERSQQFEQLWDGPNFHFLLFRFSLRINAVNLRYKNSRMVTWHTLTWRVHWDRGDYNWCVIITVKVCDNCVQPLVFPGIVI